MSNESFLKKKVFCNHRIKTMKTSFHYQLDCFRAYHSFRCFRPQWRIFCEHIRFGYTILPAIHFFRFYFAIFACLQCFNFYRYVSFLIFRLIRIRFTFIYGKKDTFRTKTNANHTLLIPTPPTKKYIK